MGKTFKAPPKRPDPSIASAFGGPSKKPFQFESKSLKDSNSKRVFDRFEKAGIDVNSEVDLTAARGRIFREAGRPQPSKRFGLDAPPPQKGEPPITEIDINLRDIPLPDNSVKGVQVDPGFLVNRFQKNQGVTSTQQVFMFSSNPELRYTVANFLRNANRVTKPGTDVIVKMQDTLPGSGPGRKIVMRNVDFIKKIQREADMILVGEQKVPSRGRGKQPVTWLAFRKPKKQTSKKLTESQGHGFRTPEEKHDDMKRMVLGAVQRETKKSYIQMLQDKGMFKQLGNKLGRIPTEFDAMTELLRIMQ
jgi:hypothetical protein